MEAYSLDLRKRVLAACDAGKGTTEVARLFEVSPAWVRRLKQRRRQLNTIEPLPKKNGPDPKLTPQHRIRLRQAVEQQPDLTLAELKHRLQLAASVPTICRALRALGMSFKKSRSSPMSRTAPT
jgi:transposase